MKKYIKEIDPQIVSAVERLSYEYETLKDNVAFLIEKHIDDPSFLSTEIFKKYQKEEIDAKKAFETAKKEFENNNVPETFRQHQITWNLDYQTRILTITQMCDCEVELCEKDQRTLTII